MWAGFWRLPGVNQWSFKVLRCISTVLRQGKTCSVLDATSVWGVRPKLRIPAEQFCQCTDQGQMRRPSQEIRPAEAATLIRARETPR